METLWDRTKHAFEKILGEGEKAAERMVGSFEELGDAAKARLEKARLERALFKHSAELGSAIYEIHKASGQQAGEPGGSAGRPPFEDPKVKGILEQMVSLDEALKKVESQLGKR